MEVIKIQTNEFIHRLSSIVNMDEIFNENKKKVVTNFYDQSFRGAWKAKYR